MSHADQVLAWDSRTQCIPSTRKFKCLMKCQGWPSSVVLVPCFILKVISTCFHSNRVGIPWNTMLCPTGEGRKGSFCHWPSLLLPFSGRKWFCFQLIHSLASFLTASPIPFCVLLEVFIPCFICSTATLSSDATGMGTVRNHKEG